MRRQAHHYLILGVAMLGVRLQMAAAQSIPDPILSTPRTLLWFDGNDPLGTGIEPTSGATISQWIDKSGNGLHAGAVSAPPAAIGSPVFLANSMNGLGAVSFSGNREILESQFNPVTTLGSPANYTAFTVFQTTQQNFAAIWADRPSDGPTHHVAVNNGRGFIDVNTGASSTSSSTVFGRGIPQLVTHGANGTDTFFSVNGMTQASRPAIGPVMPRDSTFLIGGGITSDQNPSAFFDGEVGEILLFSRGFSQQEQADVNAYLGDKWGVSVPVGGDAVRGLEIVTQGTRIPLTENSRQHQPPPTTHSPQGRLAKWVRSSGTWEAIAPGELEGSNVHVLIHGWGRGERDWVESNPGSHVWDMTGTSNGVDSDFFQSFQTLAQSIENSYGASTMPRSVVAFSWIDASATADEGGGLTGVPPAPNEPRASQSYTESAGAILANALRTAGVNSANGATHLIGHSHGAKVATSAALDLENSGINVAHLTLLDSPETTFGPDNWYQGSYNNLDNDELRALSIGLGSDQTFVDNYFSAFGRGYDIDGVVNVELNPDGLDDFGASHSYPISWYAQATFSQNGFALGWSPLRGTQFTSLDEDYIQLNTPGLPTSHDLTPRRVVENYMRPSQSTSFYGNTIATEGGVTLSGLTQNGAAFNEQSPAYWDVLFDLGINDFSLALEYEFVQLGDGDQIGIWVDDQLRYIAAGLEVGFGRRTVAIDLSDLDAGRHLLTFGLHSIGGANASFVVRDIRLITQIPEPCTAAMCVGGMCVGLFVRRTKAAVS